MQEDTRIPTQIRLAVHDALELLEGAQWDEGKTVSSAQPDSLPSLLEQCGAFASQPKQQEPIRLIHHLACTGGTVMTKCLACSPNMHVLSEVDPLSTLVQPPGKFTPGDLLSLAEFSNRSPKDQERIELFMAGLERLYESNTGKGLRLLLRDHAHSHFCVDEKIPQRPTLAEIIREQFDTRSVVTVRHPLDSYLSLLKNNWISFSPPSLEEYAKRYKAFLAAYHDTIVFKYEDFLADAEQVMQQMCAELEITFPDEFRDLFMAHSFSGDSGRKGDVIEPRERRSIPDELMIEIHDSLAFKSLCRQLHYEIEE